MNNIRVNELINKPNIIDIRSYEKYNSSHIEGSVNIPKELLLNNPSKYLTKNNTYYIYCQRGISSNKVCIMLSSLGYRVVNVIGGYEEYLLTMK